MAGMNWRAIAVSVAGAALLAAGVAWVLHTYERVPNWIDQPRTGEAATNPLHALRLSLAQHGVTVRADSRLDFDSTLLGPADTLLYDGDPRGLSAPVRARLGQWLQAGGHLIIATPAPDAAVDALAQARRFPGLPAARYLPVPLLDAYRIHARLQAPKCASLPNGDDTGLFCNGRRFAAPATALQHWGDAAQGDVVARLQVGRGTLDVLADLDFLSTANLQESRSVELVAQLFPLDARGPHRGTVHLVHVTEIPSLWLLLVREGWKVWLPLLLALAGWLAARMRRFGPVLPAANEGRRSLLEHVVASGEHQWRYRRADRLHAAMRDAFVTRLRRRDPQTAALEGEAHISALVDRLRLPASQIRDALRTPDAYDAKAVVARIATLVRMRNRL